ncbi:fas-binding factor 1 homolog [Anneissia japonica]|uniref:fas-binding factor 1 homolog n=1 Tax=Anneissia japonica TaxID=1529436 RepID=UPI0014257D60|nr:fas-binding factor 1 homolog [Anneissia japonica]
MSLDKGKVEYTPVTFYHPDVYSRDFGTFDVTVCRGYDNSKVVLVVMSNNSVLNGNQVKVDESGVLTNTKSQQYDPRLQSYYNSAMHVRNYREIRKYFEQESNPKVKRLDSVKTLSRKMRALLHLSRQLTDSLSVQPCDIKRLDDIVKNVVRSVHAKLKSTQNAMLINRELYEQTEILKKTLNMFCVEVICSNEIRMKESRFSTDSPIQCLRTNERASTSAQREDCRKEKLKSQTFIEDDRYRDLRSFSYLSSEITNLKEDLAKMELSHTICTNKTRQSFWRALCNPWKRNNDKDKLSEQSKNSPTTRISIDIDGAIQNIIKYGATSPEETHLMSIIDASVWDEVTRMRRQNLESKQIVHELLNEIDKQEKNLRSKDSELNGAREHIGSLIQKSKSEVNKLVTEREKKHMHLVKLDQDRCRLQEDKSLMSIELERLRQTNRRLLNEVCCLRHSNRELEQLMEKGHDQRLQTEAHPVRGAQLKGFYGSGQFTPGLYLRQVANISSPALVTTDNMMRSSQYNLSTCANFDDSEEDSVSSCNSINADTNHDEFDGHGHLTN